MIKSKSRISFNKSKLLFFMLLLLLASMLLFTIPRITLPLIVSYVLALIVRPAIPLLGGIGIGKNGAIAIIFVCLMLFFALPFVKLVPAIKAQTENFQLLIPKVENYVRSKYYEAIALVKAKSGYTVSNKMLEDTIQHGKKSTKMFLLKIPQILASFLEWLFLVPLFLFFLLKEERRFKRFLLQFVPNLFFERAYYLYYQFNKKLGNYMLAKFIEASFVGAIIIIGLLFMNIRFSFLLGILAGVTNIIPYVGPILGMIPAVVVCLVEDSSSATLGAVLLLYLIANIVDIVLVFPVLVSKIVNLHPIVVIVSVILGSQYLGVAGMIISIPVAAIFKLIFIEIFRELYPDLSKQQLN